MIATALASIGFCLSIIAIIGVQRVLARLNDHAKALGRLSAELAAIEKSERLTPTKLAELADVQDAIQKGNAILKRINQREVMRDRRDKELIETPIDGAGIKDMLRRKAGLVAGKPAPHA